MLSPFNCSLYERLGFKDERDQSLCSDGYISVHLNNHLTDYMALIPFITASPDSSNLAISTPVVRYILSSNSVLFDLTANAIKEVELFLILDMQLLQSHSPFLFNITAQNEVSSLVCEVRVFYLEVNHPPVIADATFHLPLYSENNTIVGTVFALDPDENQVLTFSILRLISICESLLEELLTTGSRSTASHFAINPFSGILSLIDPDLFNQPSNRILIHVLVADNGSPSLNNT